VSNPSDLLFIGLTVLAFVAPIVIIVIGIQRMRGRRFRFDSVFDGIARSQDASVYPESLRGHQTRTVAKSEDAARAEGSTRSAPSRIHPGEP
jgi:hypothetical protein